MGNVIEQDSTVQNYNLDRGIVYREIVLHLSLQPTVTAANNIAANLGRMEAWSFLKRIQIVADGSDILRDFTGDELAMMNYFLYRVPPRREAYWGDGVTPNPVADRIVRIPFWMPGISRPASLMLDARRLSSLVLRVQFGTFTDVNSAATAWTTVPTLEVWSEFVMEGRAHRLGPFHTWREYSIATQYSAQQNSAQVILPVGHLYRGFMVNTYSQAAGAFPQDVVGFLKEFRWQSGSTMFADLIELVLREKFYNQYGLQNRTPSELSASSFFNPDAWFFYDHMDSGRLDDGIDSLGFAQLTLQNDIVGIANGFLSVHPMLIVPVRQRPIGAHHPKEPLVPLGGGVGIGEL
jgi:hypothetical protein